MTPRLHPGDALFPPRTEGTTGAVEPAEYQLMDAAEAQMWWYRALHARVADALRLRPGTDGALLDAGCGTGGALRRLQAGAARALFGLEYNAGAARRAHEKTGLPIASGDVNAMPFADATFGAVVSLDVLSQRGVDPARALAEYHRVLRPGGTLVLNMPAFAWMRSAHDVRVHVDRRTTVPELRAELATAGFARVDVRYWNSLLFPLMVLQRKVLARGPDHASDVGVFPPWLNALLHGATAFELAFARIGLRYPAGGSILAIATRP